MFPKIIPTDWKSKVYLIVVEESAIDVTSLTESLSHIHHVTGTPMQDYTVVWASALATEGPILIHGMAVNEVGFNLIEAAIQKICDDGDFDVSIEGYFPVTFVFGTRSHNAFP